MTEKISKISNGMNIVTVIPFKKGFPSEELTYFTAQEISVGSIVEIPIRNKTTLGLVIDIHDASSNKSSIKGMQFNLKKITVVKERSIFTEELIESIFSTCKYFLAKKNTGITSLIPTVLREEYDKIYALIKKNNLEQQTEEERSKIKSEKLLFQTSLENRISHYKTLIRESFAKKKSIFIVLPSEYDVSLYSSLLSKGIEDFCISIHGSLTPKKQLEKVEKIVSTSHPILIIGTTPFLSIPRNDIDIIILENESSNAYKMISNPYFDLRTYVEIFASKNNIKYVLADSLLSFETIARKDIDNFGELSPLSFKINFEGNIEIPNKSINETFKVLRDNTISEIENALNKNQNVFIFSLRKGLATLTVCNDCNLEVLCENCNAPLVLYLSRDGKKRMFACNRCKVEANPETKCKNCESWNLVPLGIGTDTVYEAAKKYFPNTKIFKFDKEVIKTNKEAENTIKEFEESTCSILIGTEMAISYIKTKLPLSIIASFDSLWSIPNYNISEKIIRIITSIITKTEKKLIIQTKNEKDNAILSIQNENLLSFIREELNDRQNLNYPPYKRFIKITFLGDKEETLKTKNAISSVFKEYDPIIFSGFIAKQKNKYRTNILIKINRNLWSLPEISSGSSIDENLYDKLISLPPLFSISIDPEDLL